MKRCEVFIDGSSRGNPGEAGCSFIVYSEGEKIFEGMEYLGIKTNNEAEYFGLLYGIKKAFELGCDELTIFTDSELLQRQIKGLYKVRAPHLRILFIEAHNLLKNFKVWEIKHVIRENNKLADSIAKLISKGGNHGKE